MFSAFAHTQEHTQRLKLLSFGERPITFFLPKKKGKKKRGNFICTNYSPNHAPLIALPTTYGRAGSTSREMQRSVFDSLSGLLGKLGGDQQGQSVTPKIVLPVEAHQRTSERTQNRKKKNRKKREKRLVAERRGRRTCEWETFARPLGRWLLRRFFLPRLHFSRFSFWFVSFSIFVGGDGHAKNVRD